jgi:glycine oxidase ThiO
MLAPYVEAHERTPMLDLCVRSLDLYDDWIAAVRAESGIDVEYRRIGTLEVALDRAHADALSAASTRDEGVSRRWLDAQGAAREHPALGGVSGALFTPLHGYVAAAQLASALATSATRRGAIFHRAAVKSLAHEGASLALTTSGDRIEADAVVLAAGAWTNAIAGVRSPPLRPVRGQLLNLAWPGVPLSTILWGPECYIVPRTDGTLLAGATVEDVGFDERTTAAGVRDLLDAVCELVPEAWGASFLGARVGLRPATPDELPAIGPDAEINGLVHASGHYRNGVLLAPITARSIAGWVVDRRRDPVFDLFNPNRFS